MENNNIPPSTPWQNIPSTSHNSEPSCGSSSFVNGLNLQQRLSLQQQPTNSEYSQPSTRADQGLADRNTSNYTQINQSNRPPNSESYKAGYQGNDLYPQQTGDENNMDYDPELSENENPFYFQVNHVLFDAHMERLRRENRPSESSSSEDL